MNSQISPYWTVPFGSCFVTGTDTGIGKTWVSAALLLAHMRAGHAVGYMKPVQTGCVDTAGYRVAPDLELVQAVSGFTPPATLQDAVCPDRYVMAASPHLAAAEEGATIDMKRLLTAYRRMTSQYPNLIVEGAGGVLVPLNEHETMLDLMQQLGLPVLVVGRAGLGTLNHTLLTIQAILSAGLDVLGIVLVQSQPPPVDPEAAREEARIIADNQRTLALWSGSSIMACLPYQIHCTDRIRIRQYLEGIVAK